MGRGLLLEYDLTDDQSEDWTPEDVTKIRIDRVDGLRLAGTPAAGRILKFPTSGGPWRMDLPTWTVGAFVSWLAVDATESTKDYETDPWTNAAATAPTTTLEYQVRVGASARYWFTGGAWTAVSTNADANTLADLQTNIGAADLRALVDAAGGQLGISIVLGTTSAKWSPTATSVRLLLDVGEPDSIEDAITRSLVPALAAVTVADAWEDVAPTGDLASLDLSVDTVRDQIAYPYAAITAIYDLTNDPQRETDLAAGGFSPSSLKVDGRWFTVGTETMSSSITAGDSYRVEFTWALPARVATHRDFGVVGTLHEVSTLPEVQVRLPEVVSEMVDPDGSIVSLRTNPGDGVNDGYTVTGRRSLDLEVVLAPRAELTAGLATRMAQAIRQWLSRSRAITSAAFGTTIVVELQDAGEIVLGESGRLVHSDLRVRLYSVREPGAYAAAKLVRQATVTGYSGPPR